MPAWEQLGMQAASQGLSGAMGLILGNVYDRRQLRQQEKLQNLQIKGDKQLTDYNFNKQMEMWRNTNYPAQMAMLKAAGLNPALMYEGGGQGGSTAITQGSVTGGNAPVGGQEVQQMMAMGLTRDLQLAQIENIKAQTDKTKAETGAVAPQIQKTQAETASITQGIQNAKAQEELTKVQTSIASIDEHIKGKTQNAAVALIETNLKQATETLESLHRENAINEATKKDRIQLVSTELANKIAQWWLTQAQTANVAQNTLNSVRAMINDTQRVMIEWDKLGNQNQDKFIEWQNFMNDDAFPKELSGIISSIFGGMIGSKLTTPGKTSTSTPYEGKVNIKPSYR